MRARNIKPGLFKNERLAEADHATRLLFIGLWMMADREGRLEDRPRRIKAEILPYDDAPDITRALATLEQLGFIERYTAEGIAVIQIVNFTKHQNPHRNEKASELPERHESRENTGSQPESSNGPTSSGNVAKRTGALGLTPDSGFLNPDSGNHKDTREARSVSVRPVAVEQPRPIPINAQLAARAEARSPTPMPEGVTREVFDDYRASRAERGKALARSAEPIVLQQVVDAATEADMPPDEVLRQMTAAGWNSVRGAWLKDRSANSAKAKTAAGNHTGFADRNYHDDPWLKRFANTAEASA